jgi:hypothetical protein
MARLLNSTRFKSPSTATANFSVAIPATTAGSTLVCIAGGGAIITAKIGATAFTKRTTSLNNREVAAQDIVDSTGGTTAIAISLNGPENVDGMIYEFAAGSLGSFIAGATETGTGGNSSVDSYGRARTGTITTTGSSVVFAMFTIVDTSLATPQRQWWGFEPLGKQYANEGIAMDPSKSIYWSMIAVSDQTTASTLQAQSANIQLGTAHQSVVWAYEDLSGGVATYANPYANAIAAENSLPGTYYNKWLSGAADATRPEISGYTGSMSYNPGDTVDFKVYSNNIGFNVEIVRVGHYGYFPFGGRAQATVAGTPVVQPAPTVNSYGGTECAWTTNATWTIPATATPGIYSYTLRRNDNVVYQMMGNFVVKSPVPATKSSGIMLTTADFTWQAYNPWGAVSDSGGGYSGYTGRYLYGTAPSPTNSNRAFAVSFDRPLATVASNALTYYWDSEGGLVSFLEANGYDVSYYTMIDVDKDPTLPSKFTTAISQGHNEYWSANLRDAYENARDAGTNLFFATSNTSLWHVRFDPADTNRRNMICYKDSHDTTGYDNVTKYDPVSYTGSWRDARTIVGGVNNTSRRPESGMTGQWFIGNGTFVDSLAVPNTYNTLPLWRNTPIATGGVISVRGTSSASLGAAATSITISLPASTKTGDLVLISIIINENSGNFSSGGLRIVSQQINDTATMKTVLIQLYAAADGATAYTFNWGASLLANAACVAYAGAVWEDTDNTTVVDTSGSATHTTVAATSGGSNRWAVCIFADIDSTGGAKTTSWTPGSGLTSRIEVDNAALAGGPWSSITLMDTNGSVTQGAHQYSATAQFANPHAVAAMMYISPGTVLFGGAVGAEWDYVKNEEPTTPKNMVMLSRQATQITAQRAGYDGSSYNANGMLYYGMTLYQAPSGALVFNSGSWRFTWGLSRFRNGGLAINGTIDVTMQQAVINLLGDFGHNPTTLLGTTANLATPALVGPGSRHAASEYGLPAVAPVDYKSIFDPTVVPTTTNNNDATQYTLGTLFTASASGKIYGARWNFPDTLPTQPVIATLYAWNSDSSGTQLATATFSNCQTGWSEVLFSSPVSISANTKYVITVWTSDFYAATPALLASAGVTNSSSTLTAPQDTSTAHNGKYRANSTSGPLYPTSSFNGGCYFADVLYVGDGIVQFEGWGIPTS